LIYFKFTEMNLQEENISNLVSQLLDADLYKLVVQQIKKDFELSGQAIDINEFTSPENLVKEIYKKIQYLLEHNFDAYLQVLYRVDLPEEVMNFGIQNTESIAQRATFYIVQKEWKKVKLRGSFK